MMSPAEVDSRGLGSVLFFFPFRPPSGVSNLFRRMADHLADHYQVDVAVVDYPDGHMAKNLRPESRVRILPFYDGVPFYVPPETTLVMQTMIPYAVRPELRIPPDTRMVFWHLLPYALVNTIFPFAPFRAWQMKHPGAYQKIMKALHPKLLRGLKYYVETLADRKSLLFQDRFTINQTAAFLDFKVQDPILLPIAVEVPPLHPRVHSPNRTCLRFGWIGQLYDFKIHILIHTLERISNLAARRKLRITFTVVGDGDFLDKLLGEQFNHEYFQLYLAGAVESGELSAIIQNQMDVVAAMGTSALEVARVGVPAILLDWTLQPIRGNYRFKWLFEALEGDIGHDILPEDMEEEDASIESIIDQLLSDPDTLARKCYDYCLQTHGIEAIGRKFIKAVSQGTFRYRDTPESITRKNLLRKFVEYRKYKWRPWDFIEK